jgi:hypothetical protein
MKSNRKNSERDPHPTVDSLCGSIKLITRIQLKDNDKLGSWNFFNRQLYADSLHTSAKDIKREINLLSATGHGSYIKFSEGPSDAIFFYDFGNGNKLQRLSTGYKNSRSNFFDWEHLFPEKYRNDYKSYLDPEYIGKKISVQGITHPLRKFKLLSKEEHLNPSYVDPYSDRDIYGYSHPRFIFRRIYAAIAEFRQAIVETLKQQLKLITKHLVILLRKMLRCLKRDIRKQYRDIIRFLFKNMDDQSGDDNGFNFLKIKTLLFNSKRDHSWKEMKLLLNCNQLQALMK